MNHFKKMAYPYVAWISVMVVAPMLLIVMYAFIEQGNDVTTFKFTLSNFTRFFSDSVYTDVLYRSLYVALITTLICLLIGYPAAYIIAMAKPKHKAALVLLITFPTWINMLVRTYAWLGILQDNGIINSFLGLFGIEPIQMIYTNFAVILGMVYNFVPFMILQIYSALDKMDKSYLEAASDLGANRVQSFLRVTFPMKSSGSHKRHNPRVSPRRVEFLYSKAPWRRTVRPHRKRHRDAVPYGGRLGIRQRHFSHNGHNNNDISLYYPQAGY